MCHRKVSSPVLVLVAVVLVELMVEDVCVFELVVSVREVVVTEVAVLLVEVSVVRVAEVVEDSVAVAVPHSRFPCWGSAGSQERNSPTAISTGTSSKADPGHSEYEDGMLVSETVVVLVEDVLVPVNVVEDVLVDV